MSEKNLVDEKPDSEEDEDDDDYCPAKNVKQQSDSSGDSEDDGGAVEQTESADKNDASVAPYDESKTNELWKNFSSSIKKPVDTPAPKVEQPAPKPVNKVFEFAGEKVIVPVTTPAAASPSLKRPATTSSSLLDRLGLGKKQKLSTLEKSRLDWDAHKQSEALVEDLESHRRGKDSYVEKKAFLERSELRQHDHFLNHAKKK